MNAAPIALVFSGFGAGGVPRVMLALAREFLAAGHAVDLVVVRDEGPARADVPEGARIVDLESRQPAASWRQRLRKNRHRVLAAAPALAAYIDEARPVAMLSGGNYVNFIAVRARARARHACRLVVSHHAQLSIEAKNKPFARWIARRAYPKADVVTAVSDGVADDLARRAGLRRESIQTVYNPAVTPEIATMAEQPPEHAWLAQSGPPVILGAGRLSAQKDFPTLIRAFALLAEDRDLRLIILGKGKDEASRGALLRQAQELAVAERVDLPGFAANPYAYMRHAAVFVLSSGWEGFGNV
ncbi:MAG: glycosyltransferase, partial [Rhodovibrionaceae bacterium]|nr:glycosyltransferase [Rhodovibrionaceae bacterium]